MKRSPNRRRERVRRDLAAVGHAQWLHQHQQVEGVVNKAATFVVAHKDPKRSRRAAKLAIRRGDE